MAKTFLDKINEHFGNGYARADQRGTLLDPDVLTLIDSPDGPWGDLHEPRALLGLDEGRIADLLERGQLAPITIIEDGLEKDGRPRLLVIDGNRRVLHIREINRRGGVAGEKLFIAVRVVKGKSIAELQLLKFSANLQGEAETPATLAPKIKLALKFNSEAAIRVACKMGKPRFDALVAYNDLSAEARRAVDDGRLPLSNIADIAKIPRHEQGAAIEKLLETNSTKVHQIRETLSEVREGKAPRPKGDDGKKIWKRTQIQGLRDYIDEQCPANRTTQAFIAALNVVLGNTGAVKDFDDLKAATDAFKRTIKKREKKRAEEKAATEATETTETESPATVTDITRRRRGVSS